MADELPNVGDLARVVGVCGCEHSRKFLGRYYAVTTDLGAHCGTCDYCGHDLGRHDCVALDCHPASCVPRAWLRRVPPLAELESIDIATELESERPRERVTA